MMSPLLHLTGPQGRIALVVNKISAISDAADFLRTGTANVQTQVYTDRDSDPFNVCEPYEDVCAKFAAALGE
jgi:hypothetical protein